jgi:hypothetical protein
MFVLHWCLIHSVLLSEFFLLAEWVKPVAKIKYFRKNFCQGILKGRSITVPLTSCLTGLDYSVLQIKTKIVSCNTADSKPVKQEVNVTVILPTLVFPGFFTTGPGLN